MVAALAACGGGSGSGDAAPTSPATSASVAITVTSTVASGERFVFGLGTQQATVTTTGVAASFGTALASGSSYVVNQLSGPRTCSLSANRSGTVGTADISVTADCGAPVAASSLGGRLYGPVGASAVLQNQGGDDLTASVLQSVGGSGYYDATAFSFATAQAGGTGYNVSVRSSAAGLSCQTFAGATGTVPVAASVLRVGCEYTTDLVSRAAAGPIDVYAGAQHAVIGGASVAIGQGATDVYGEGRFVAFVSSAAVSGASGKHRQVLLRDRLDGTVHLVSAAADGSEGNDDSWNPAISADGLTVVFESFASNLVAGDSNGVKDVFVWDAHGSAPKLSRVSVGQGGVQFSAASGMPTVNGDGTVVAFETLNSNLTTNQAGTDNTVVVVRRVLAAATNQLVSRTPAGAAVDGGHPMLSEDGNRLVFYSQRDTIVTGDANGLWDLFVFDATAGSTTRVSLTASGGERNQGSESASRSVAPAISGDGRWVAYATTATNVVGGDTNGLQDVFVVDTQTGAVSRASLGTSGAQGTADSPIGQGERLALSHDGIWVAFTSTAGNLGVGTSTTGIGNVFMHNRVTGETRALTANTSSGGVTGPVAMSRSGAYVLFLGSNALDPRFGSSGLFARFTGLGRPFSWFTN